LSSIGISLITLLSTFAGGVLGLFAHTRLPQSSLDGPSKDVVRLGMGLVATMTALLLGLVTASAKGTFDVEQAAIRTTATKLLSLDRDLARYGPETQAIRASLKTLLAYRIEMTWGHQVKLPPSQTTARAEALETQILALSPRTEEQRWFRSQALDLVGDVLAMRWSMLGTASESKDLTFLTVVIAWLTLTFISFGLFAPRTVTVVGSFLVAALSVAAAVFLILELNTPLSGQIMVSGEPLRFALANLGQ
jgi:hypothetical protein